MTYAFQMKACALLQKLKNNYYIILVLHGKRWCASEKLSDVKYKKNVMPPAGLFWNKCLFVGLKFYRKFQCVSSIGELWVSDDFTLQKFGTLFVL